MYKTIFLMAALLIGGALTGVPAAAWGETCTRCGCECGCHAICRPRCTTQTETVREYACECEDFCVPGSIPHEGCASCDGGCDGNCFSLFGVRIYTRKKLMVREVTREAPTTEYEVEYLCPSCAGSGCDTGRVVEMPCAPERVRPPAPVRIEPQATAPQPRATLLERLLEGSR